MIHCLLTIASNRAGMFISLTAVQQWLSDTALKRTVTKEVLSGRKKVCLAILTPLPAATWPAPGRLPKETTDGKHCVAMAQFHCT